MKKIKFYYMNFFKALYNNADEGLNYTITITL
jgi:hypothetical protein